MISHPSSATIAVVDDHPAVSRALVHLLRSHGFVASRWNSGRDFLARADLPALSCVVLDLRLPALSGFEIQQRLRADGHGCPVIFFSGGCDATTAARAHDAGAFACLQKPRDLPVLIETIRRACAFQTALNSFRG